jgi:hypothetical protein
MDQSEQDTVQTGLPAPAAQPQPREAAAAEGSGVAVFVTKNVSIYYSSRSSRTWC